MGDVVAAASSEPAHGVERFYQGSAGAGLNPAQGVFTSERASIDEEPGE